MTNNKLEQVRSQDERYHKNVLYISPEEQEKIKNKTIFLAGVGLGSVIAETALRMGFEKFILVDGDEVELANLNRQNYTANDISKVTSIEERLKTINPEVQIATHHLFLSPDNIHEHLQGVDIAINAIDFDSTDTPFAFDQACQELGIPVIHPFNQGWASGACLITPESEQLFDVVKGEGRFELTLIENIIDYCKDREDIDLDWFKGFLDAYKLHSKTITPPQLSVGSSLAAGLVTNLLFCLTNDIPAKTFPHLHFLSTR